MEVNRARNSRYGLANRAIQSGSDSPMLRWSQDCFFTRQSWSSALESFRSQFQEIKGLVGEGLPVLVIGYSLDCHDLYL